MDNEQIKQELDEVLTESIKKFSLAKFGDGINIKTILIPDMMKYINDRFIVKPAQEKAPTDEIKGNS